MKIKVLLFSVMGMIATSAIAQEAPVKTHFEPTEAAMKTSFKPNGAADNWFISINGGAQMLDKDENRDAELMNRLNAAPFLSIGKWHNPWFATRIQLTGGVLHGFESHVSPADFMQHNKYAAAHFDFMFDMNNYFGIYKSDRVFHFVPWVGIGYAQRFRNDQEIPAIRSQINKYESLVRSESPTVNGGLMLAFRLSDRVHFNVEGQMMLLQEHFNRVKMHHTTDIIYQLGAGLTFNLGKTDWEPIEPMDYALLNDLNNQINALRAENEELSKRPVSCPECPEVKPTVINNTVDNVVFFRLDSSRIDKNQEINIFNTAEFVKAHNTPIKVIGYADEKTGTSPYNLRLSEKRARNVAKQLIEKYGVSSDMITIEWQGDEVQPYSINAWNRVVIMRANDK